MTRPRVLARRPTDSKGSEAAKPAGPSQIQEAPTKAPLSLERARRLGHRVDRLVQRSNGNGIIQRAVEGRIVNLWAREHNQTIALGSGDANTVKEAVGLDDDNITINISEKAVNHFANRHTMKEFSFKDENIRDEKNTMWEEGTDAAGAQANAKKVIEGSEDDFKEAIGDGEDTQAENKVTVDGLTVGYVATLAVDDDSLDVDSGKFERGTGNLVSFFPHADNYDDYDADELREIRQRLQAAPHYKQLQLKRVESKK